MRSRASPAGRYHTVKHNRKNLTSVWPTDQAAPFAEDSRIGIRACYGAKLQSFALWFAYCVLYLVTSATDYMGIERRTAINRDRVLVYCELVWLYRNRSFRAVNDVW